MKKSNMDIEVTAAHIDVLPTLAEICNVEKPEDRKIDGINLLPFIEEVKEGAPERPLFFYWTRHNPELYSNIALQKGSYKLVGHTDYDAPIKEFELFDICKDPFERVNIAGVYQEIALDLKKELDLIFRELVNSENLMDQPFIEVGSKFENPVILNRNDADGQWGIWDQEEIFGKWRLIINEGSYNLKFKFIKPVPANGRMMVETQSFINQIKNEAEEADMIEMENVYLPKMKCDFVPFYQIDSRRIFPFWVEIEKKK